MVFLLLGGVARVFTAQNISIVLALKNARALKKQKKPHL
jgi:hypothetical protein